MLLYKDSIAYILTVALRGDILEFVINLEEPLRRNTRGLLGNFNGDDTDDLIMSDGRPLPSSASDTMIHEFGQSCQFLAYGSHVKLSGIVCFYRANIRAGEPLYLSIWDESRSLLIP